MASSRPTVPLPVNITWQDRRFAQNADRNGAIRALAFRVSAIRYLNNHVVDASVLLPAITPIFFTRPESGFGLL